MWVQLGNFPLPYKGLEEWVLHMKWHPPLKTGVAVTTMGLSMQTDLVEWAGMWSERWSVHKIVLEPIYIVGQGVAERWWTHWWFTCIQGTFRLTDHCPELGKEWQKAGITGAKHG
jgi:hypothetical protein